MKKSLVILSLAVLVFSGCQQFKKGDGGMLYKIHTDKDGPVIKEGDFMVIKAIQKTEGDSVIYSSYDYDRPSFMVQQKPSFKGDLFAGLALLSEGDSATFKIDIDSMEKKLGQPRPAGTKGKYMVYVLKVDKVLPKGKMNDAAFNAMVDEFLKKETQQAKVTEESKLNKFIASKGLKVQTTPSGLRYVVTMQGNGPKAVKSDTVEVNYTGYLVGGTNKVFDTSIEADAKKAGIFNPNHGPYIPIKIPVGVQASIPGFDEALSMFPMGTKVKVIMPSNLAYGERGNQAIPPYTTLVFDLELLKVYPAKPGSAPQAAIADPAAEPKK